MANARVLHLADLHFDSVYGGAPETRARLRLATLEAFGRAVRFAVREDLDAVLIVGDAFDEGSLGYEARTAFRRGLRELLEAEIEVVYVTGNHDPGGDESSARRLGIGPGAAQEGPLAGVRVAFDGQPRTFLLERRGRPFAHAVCAGHDGPRVTDDLAARLVRPAPDGLPALAVLHTQVSSARGAEGHEPYAPSNAQALAASGFDYWALGHVHVRGRAARNVPAWYPGNIQGRNGRESGPKGGLLVELDGSGLCRPPRFVRFGPVEFMTLALDDPGDADPTPEAIAEGAARAFGVRMAERRLPAPDEVVLRLECPFQPGSDGALAAAVRAELQGILGGLELLEVELRTAPGATGPASLDGAMDAVLSSPSALREALELARGIALAGELPEALDVPWARGSAPAEVVALTRGLDEELMRRALDTGELDPSEETGP